MVGLSPVAQVIIRLYEVEQLAKTARQALEATTLTAEPPFQLGQTFQSTIAELRELAQKLPREMVASSTHVA